MITKGRIQQECKHFYKNGFYKRTKFHSVYVSCKNAT